MPPVLHVGTSGFASASPASPSRAATDLLHAYAERFRSVEMDSTFSRAPSRPTVESWVSAAPALSYSVRVPKTVTHAELLGDPGSVADVAGRLEPLGNRLACMLFTTPPQMDCDVRLVARALDAVPEGTRTAWEFRHGSWACPEVVELLVACGSAPVVVDTLDGVSGGDLLPGGALWGRAGLPFLYVRLRRDRYRVPEILGWADLLSRALAEGVGVFAFFKQGPESAAYATALEEVLSEMAGVTLREPGRPATS